MQLDYNDLAPAVLGGLADAGENIIVSGVSAAVQNFGKGLAYLNTGLIALQAATGFTFAGVTVNKNKAKPNSTGIAVYDIGEAISILRSGRIWVNAEEAINPTLAVFLRHTANGGLVPGDFRTDLDGANADAVPNARWVSTTAAAGLAILEINLP